MSNIFEKFRKICGKSIDIPRRVWYNNTRKAGDNPLKGEEKMSKEMTNKQFDAYLETLAQLVESKAKTVEEAAEIIRNAKTEE